MRNRTMPWRISISGNQTDLTSLDLGLAYICPPKVGSVVYRSSPLWHPSL
jgi:hypothetical protein